jgi:integrase
VLIVERAGGPVYFAKWRDSTGRQVKKRLGPAWVERGPDGEWRRRHGRVPDDVLEERAAVVAMSSAIATHEASLAEPRTDRRATFADAAATWLHHLEHVDGAKPSTLADYRYMLSSPETLPRKRGRRPTARIMRAFGDHPLASITTADVNRFLATLDADPEVTPRTVNRHRQLLCSVFAHAMRADTFRLAFNPAAATDKRREPEVRPVDFYEPEEVRALARATCAGVHRDASRPAVSDEELADRVRADEQDAALFIVAAFSGLRLGELLALRWRHVDFADAKLLVEASWSAGRLTTPKSRKWRAVPLADQPAAVLDQLSQRALFTCRDDLVFCSAVGDYLDPSALRRRYRRAQKAAGLRPLRFHDLRHSFGSLVIREFDPVAVKDFMGHAKITTTERYLHARSRRTDAARMTKAFAGEADTDVAVAT